MRAPFLITVNGPDGLPLPGASVEVRDRPTSTTGLVYALETGGTPVDNPLTTDAGGRVKGYAEEGRYTAVCSHPSLTTFQFDFNLTAEGPGVVQTVKLADAAVTAAKLGSLSIAHAWVVRGEVKTADFFGFLPIFAQPGQLVILRRVIAVLDSGTSVTFDLRKTKAGAALTGYAGLGATTATNVVRDATAPQTLVDGERLWMVPTAVAGTPKGLVVGIELDKG